MGQPPQRRSRATYTERAGGDGARALENDHRETGGDQHDA